MCPYSDAMMAMLVSSVSVPLATKTSVPYVHPVRDRMALSVRIEETACVADASATGQSREAISMATFVSATMKTVRGSRINYVEVKFPSF